MKWTYLIGVILLGISILGVVFTSWPIPESATEIPFIQDEVNQGKLVLYLPNYIRVGEPAEVRLRIEYNPDNLADMEIQKLKLITRLEVAYLEVTPKGDGYTIINADSVAVFIWQVRSAIPGSFSGLVWLFEEGTGGNDTLILGREIKIDVREFLGMTYPAARVLFIGGMLIGLILIIPNLLAQKHND